MKIYPPNKQAGYLDVPLFPMQETIANLSVDSLKNNKYSILKLGQRSGKNVIAAHVAKKMGAELVYVFDTYSESLSSYFPLEVAFCETQVPKFMQDGNCVANSIAIINEAFWMERSFGIFQMIRNTLPVLVLGSNGPFFDSRWKEFGGQSHAAWEVNPNLTREELIVPGDPKAMRDYGAF